MRWRKELVLFIGLFILNSPQPSLGGLATVLLRVYEQPLPVERYDLHLERRAVREQGSERV